MCVRHEAAQSSSFRAHCTHLWHLRCQCQTCPCHTGNATVLCVVDSVDVKPDSRMNLHQTCVHAWRTCVRVNCGLRCRDKSFSCSFVVRLSALLLFPVFLSVFCTSCCRAACCCCPGTSCGRADGHMEVWRLKRMCAKIRDWVREEGGV